MLRLHYSPDRQGPSFARVRILTGPTAGLVRTVTPDYAVDLMARGVAEPVNDLLDYERDS